MSTVFVTMSDARYYHRAMQTIGELRDAGRWTGDIVYIAIDFDPPSPIPGVIVHRPEHVDHTPLWKTWETHPIRKMEDNRHYAKVCQWDKLQVFSDYFKMWQRVVFLDAGVRVLDSVHYLLEQEYRGKLLSHKEAIPGDCVGMQLDLNANIDATVRLCSDFGPEVLQAECFLNCMFLFDTSLIDACGGLGELKRLMYRYPICICNEMTLMAIVFSGKMRVFEPFKPVTSHGKILFAYSENSNDGARSHWSQFCFLKYSLTK